MLCVTCIHCQAFRMRLAVAASEYTQGKRGTAFQNICTGMQIKHNIVLWRVCVFNVRVSG